MSKFKIIALIAVITLAFAGTAIDNAMAAERYKVRTSNYIVKWDTIEVGDEEGHVVGVGESNGIVTNMEGKTFGDGLVKRLVGFVDMNTKTRIMSSTHGYVDWTDKDGDKIYFTYEGQHKGTLGIVKGTGKYEGIKGKGTWVITFVGPRLWFTDEEFEVELP